MDLQVFDNSSLFIGVIRCLKMLVKWADVACAEFKDREEYDAGSLVLDKK